MPDSSLTIDRMEEVRADNNVLWMTILRIAMEAEPEKTAAVIAQIAVKDGKIKDLWAQLANE